MAELNLDQFAASGIYTLEYDASVNITIPVTTGRLVIGTGRRGPINSLVLLRDSTSKNNVYGPRDYYLENKGSYFHKSLEVMLGEGPVYALNLLPIDLEDDRVPSGDDAGHTNLDKTYFTTFNTESADTNGDAVFPELGYQPELPVKSPLKNFYNKQKFWYASDVELTKTKNKEFGETLNIFGTIHMANKILSFANLSKRQVSIFLKKSDVQGYDITIKEWYSTFKKDEQIPSFMHSDDFISDYMIDVIIVEGDWTNYKKLAHDPIYSRYFNTSGLIVSKISEFLSTRTINVIERVTGCLIPDFQNTSNSVISIDRVVNNLYPLTEIICAIDTEKVDAMNREIAAFNEDNIDSYRIDIVGQGYDENMNSIDDGTNKMIDVLSYRSPITKTFKYKETNASPLAVDSVVFESTGSPAVYTIKAYEDSNLFKLWECGYLVNGDFSTDIWNSPSNQDVYVKITGEFIDNTMIPGADVRYIIIGGYSDSTLLNEIGLNVGTEGSDLTVVFETSITDYSEIFSMSLFDSYQLVAPNKLKIETTTVSSADLATVFEFIKPGAYLKARVTDERPRMLKILSVAQVADSTSPSRIFYMITTMSSYDANVSGINLGTTGSESITVYKGIHNYITSLRGAFIDGFKLRAELLPNGTTDRQVEIYKYMFDTNIASAISGGEPIQVRHIVDSFEGEISDSSKYYISKLAATHAKALCFTNGPSWRQFERSVDPSFIDSYNGLIRADYIVTGGNLELNPSYTYQFASEDVKGVPMESFVICTIPNLAIRENDKNRLMIPAPYVSNAYLRKIKSGNANVIVAGKNGMITESEVQGVEYEFSDPERGYLEPAGYNLLIKRRNTGTMLFTNNTLYQRVNSALNNAHVRDNLITIEGGIENILFNFLFDYNESIVQVRVKTLVENYLSNSVASKSIAWYDVMMDSSNNTNYVKENNAGILDVLVDFNRGIHKFINRITITRVGGQLSATQSGFSISA